ncbi:MAG: Holliday junction resolvase RuvX [Anaerolineales bacterium]
MRYLAIDPGDKHLGVAVSDPLGLIARPLATLAHESRLSDVERILALAREQRVESLIVGVPLGAEDEAGPQARKALRLVEALRAQTPLPVIVPDESFSSQTAQTIMLEAGKRRRARRAPKARGRSAPRFYSAALPRREQEHAVAAAAILQSYLDAHSPETPTD